MKHLLKLGGLTPEEITHILDVADEYKRLHRDGIDPKDLQGKAVALIFAKNSTRTRASLEVGIYQMGGLGTYLSANDLQTARGEPVQDTARVLGRYYDAIVCRTYKQTTLDALVKYSGIPVISGMTDYAHPLQVLTDLMTVRERKGALAGLKAGFIGDGYNMANSVIVGCLAMGMAVTVACPKHYRPAADVLMLAQRYGDKFTLTNDPDEAARDADVLFTDVWVSMGMEREAEQRRRDFTGFTLDAARTRCPPTAARRLPPMCWKGTWRRFLTRPRTGFTWKRPCWQFCWRGNKVQEAGQSAALLFCWGERGFRCLPLTGCVILDISLSKECRYVKTNAATKNPTCTGPVHAAAHCHYHAGHGDTLLRHPQHPPAHRHHGGRHHRTGAAHQPLARRPGIGGVAPVGCHKLRTGV